MKQFLLCCLLLFSQKALAQTDWKWLNPEPSGYSGRDLYFFDEQLGFLVNSGQILRTQNGGASWSVVEEVRSGYKIAFQDSVGYVVGGYGDLYKSVDRGESWKQIGYNFPWLNAISLIDKDSVFITGSDQLFVSYDGGASWIARSVEAEQKDPFGHRTEITDSYFTSSLVGHAVCRRGMILKTTDGGLGWYTTESTNVSPSDFFDVTFVNDMLGFASQQHNDLYQTTDGGETWQEIQDHLDAAYSIQFLDEKIGFIAGEYGAMYKTTDGGGTWEWIGFDGRISYNDIFTVHFVNENLGFAAGARGRIIKTTDGGKNWTQYAMSYQDIADVQRIGKSIFVLGESIYRSDDGGQVWTDIAPPMSEGYAEGSDYYKAGHFFSPDEAIVIAVGRNKYDFDVVLKTEDGGQTWREINIFANFRNGNKLFFLNDSVGYIGSSDYTYESIYKTTDQGETWQPVLNSPRSSEFYFLDEQRGFALRHSALYQSQDGGGTWEKTYDSYNSLNEIHFISSTVGYIAADNGVVLKTTDGGKSWENLSTEYDHLQTISFYNEWVGLAAAEYGHLYRTFNGGKDWEKVQTPAPITTLIIDSTGMILAGGDNGVLLRSMLPATELVDISQIGVKQITDSSAVLSSPIRSSLSTTQIWVEYGTKPGDYTQRIPLTLPNGYFEDTISFTMQPLEDSTRYYSRFSVAIGNTFISSPELSFQTDYRPTAEDTVTNTGNPPQDGQDSVTVVEDPVTALELPANVDATGWVYPNTFDEELFIKLDQPEAAVEVCLYSLTGSSVYAALPHQFSVREDKLRIATGRVPPGVYLLRVVSLQKVESVRVIKRRR